MKIARWLSAIFIVVVTVCSLGFVKFQQIQAAMAMAESFPEPSATVNTVVTQASDYQDSEKITGQVSATQIVKLQNELGGIISKINFVPGQQVTKGQLLIALNTAEEEAQLDATKANLELSQSNYERLGKLLKQNKISQHEFDQAQAQLKVNKANLANLKAVIAKKKVYAPFSGTVDLSTYQEGQFIAANSVITTLVGNEPEVWIDFQLAQTKNKLKIDDTVLIKSINGDNNSYKAAKIIAKNSQIKAASRHLEYRAELPLGRQDFEHNEIVDIKILGANKSVMFVPSSAISRNQHGDYLFVLKKDENEQYRAHRAKVTLGKRLLDQQVITSGIEEGQLIATEGAFKLREGLLVYPQQVVAAQAIASATAGE